MTLAPTLQGLGEERYLAVSAAQDSVEVSNAKSELVKLFAYSDFIYETCNKYPSVMACLCSHLKSPVTLRWDFDDASYLDLDEPSFFQQIRIFRHKMMVLIAADDFLDRVEIVQTMHALSQLADDMFIVARSWGKAQLNAKYGKALNQRGQEVELVALGMGKLGGLELNFSSDIDLIFCYGEKGVTSEGRRQEDFQIYFVKLAQKVIQALDSVTQDGRVFRVDMRLRPFGDSGPLVCSFDSIEDYYQDQGREWERYALLKARPLGANCPISAFEDSEQSRLTSILKPFVFKRYIDFSVIESLRNMKQMIQMEVKRRALQDNIKLGEGGIREVEFIVQALQMLRGGKESQLQNPSLLQVLPELTSLGVFTQLESKGLRESYIWLRKCEQYLQAFADEQTQTLPQIEIGRQRLLSLFEHETWGAFLATFQSVCDKVNGIFQELIGEPESQKNTYSGPDLTDYTNAWHSREADQDLWHGALLLSYYDELIKSVSGARGREKLDQLIPVLMVVCKQQNISESELKEVISLIKRIASRTTYIELLLENSGALTQLIKLVASCKFIGSQLSRFPLLLDQLIDPKLLYSVPETATYGSDLRRYLLRVEPDDLELQMEVMRQFKLASQLIVAACDVEGVASLMVVSDHLTAIAEACLEQAINLAWQQMVQRYGYPDGADDSHKQFAVLGYGKLGGFELGYGSDLDLVFVHNCQSSAPTDGAKQIDSRQFYIKLAQRLMHLFTTRTLSGELYEMDTRLRPSGASGLLVINIETFREYQLQEAWTWEHQALVRSRHVAGDDSLKARFVEIREEVLTAAKDENELKQEIRSMREKMYDNLNKETKSDFDLKQSRGGIADIEFISQFLVLNYGKAHPSLLVHQDNMRILEQANHQDLLSKQDFELLSNAYLAYREHYHMASLNNAPKVIAKEQVEELVVGVSKVWEKLLGQ